MSKSGLDKLIEQVIAEKAVGYSPRKSGEATGTYKAKVQKDLGIPNQPSKKFLPLLFGTGGVDKEPDQKITDDELKLYRMNTDLLPKSGDNVQRNMIRANILFKNAQDGDPTSIKYLKDLVGRKSGDKDYADKIANYDNFFRNSKSTLPFAVDFKDKLSQLRQKLTQPTLTRKDLTGDAERSTIMDPSFVTQAAAGGKAIESQFNMFKKFFEGTQGADPKDTLIKRIQKLTDFSEQIASVGTVTEALSAEEAKSSVTDFLNKTMILDYFNTFAKDVDSGAGAYIFEAFCAYLAGGTVGGKETGASGGMGETDFFFADGTKGSAKYLKKGTKVSQSHDNFVIGQEVTYVFASKKGKDKKGASDADEIYYIDFYVFNVEKIKHGLKDGQWASYKQDGVEGFFKVKDKKVIFNTPSAPVGTLTLVTSDDKTIKQNLTSAAGKVNEMVERAAEAFKLTMGNLMEAKDSIMNYSNTGEMNPHGNKATTALGSASENFNSVVLAMTNQPEPQQPAATVKSESLDGLIETIIKKKLLK